MCSGIPLYSKKLNNLSMSQWPKCFLKNNLLWYDGQLDGLPSTSSTANNTSTSVCLSQTPLFKNHLSSSCKHKLSHACSSCPVVESIGSKNQLWNAKMVRQAFYGRGVQGRVAQFPGKCMQGIAIAMPCTIPSGHPQLMALWGHGPRIVMPAPIF